uniref:Uncharacterized protein n=1 Tax=Solanum lycopersicum TaxID=4081 RepID=A0A3Q7II15_SOLLC
MGYDRSVPVREPSLIDSLHQVIASNQLLSLGVKGRVPFLSCPKTFFILIGERLSRGKVLHIGPAAFFISLALSPSSAFRLGSALGVRLDRLGFFSSIEGSQRVSHSSPIRLVNPLLFFLLSSSSPPLHYLTGAENTTLSITRKK